MYPHHSDIDWEEYREWVFHGGEDGWFEADEEDDEDEMFRERVLETAREEQALLAGYHEAQTRLWTAYLCKDMVLRTAKANIQQTRWRATKQISTRQPYIRTNLTYFQHSEDDSAETNMYEKHCRLSAINIRIFNCLK